ncbi:MAG: plasmid mobilization relaxosome protein MobC [Micavibrio sp.]|nr:MAG: plasmid mobilization relaxosome protein MobC [Micavibrio sp.]
MAEKGKTGGKYPPPYSIRFTFEERRQLREQAGGRPVSAYIREQSLKHPSPRRRYRKLSENHAVLGELLEELGKTRLSSNLNQIAKACNSGTLDVSEETEAAIIEARDDIRRMRKELIAALGLKPNGLKPNGLKPDGSKPKGLNPKQGETP